MVDECSLRLGNSPLNLDLRTLVPVHVHVLVHKTGSGDLKRDRIAWESDIDADQGQRVVSRTRVDRDYGEQPLPLS